MQPKTDKGNDRALIRHNVLIKNTLKETIEGRRESKNSVSK